MKSPFCFIVKPQGGMRYDNLSKHGDGKLITSSSQEDHTATNRFATVEEVPILWAFNKNIKKGDTVVVHHNIFRKYYDMKGVEKSGPCHFKDDLYLVDIDQVYLHKSKDKWSSVGDYCFIKPTEKEKDVILSVDRNKQLVGKVKYGNKELVSLDILEGDDVCFLPESEYEFKIEGETLYRMKTEDICVLI
tara:strand:+ start:5060 stop:5629 length:570 start_codon:yes stop_codon:yes gene_type:complete